MKNNDGWLKRSLDSARDEIQSRPTYLRPIRYQGQAPAPRETSEKSHPPAKNSQR